MSDVDRFGEVFEGYVDLAKDLLTSWTPFVTAVSTKANSGTYTANDAEADFPAAAKLVVDSLMDVGSEAIDALSILTGDFSEDVEVICYCDAAKSGSQRTLALKDKLKSVSGQELDASLVKIKPQPLGGNETQFTLTVNGDGLKARTYDGTVVATAGGKVVEEIFVSVTIG